MSDTLPLIIVVAGPNGAGKSTFAARLRRARERGYRAHLFFLRLPDAELAVARVWQRVQDGGHNIPEEDARRRYARGGNNFFELYRPLADKWYVYDNSDYDNPWAIAAGRTTSLLRVFRWEEWLQFRRSHE